MPENDEGQRREDIEIAGYRLLVKFHNETECGEGGDHWAECDALVAAFGWVSWEAWDYCVVHGVIDSESVVGARSE